jgi:D-amino-acid dehydrogenase
VKGQSQIVVIGGGPTGACAAYALASAGATVTLLERESEVCPRGGAAYGNCGLIVPSESIPLAAPGALRQGLAAMLDSTGPFRIAPRISPSLARWLWLFRGACDASRCRKGMGVLLGLHELSARLHREMGTKREAAWLYRADGLAHVYETPAALVAAARDVEELRSLGLNAEEMSAGDAGRHAEGLQCEIAGGFFFPEDAHADPKLFTRSMADLARLSGARVETGVEALDLIVDGVRPVRVVTTRGEIEARQVVVAAGVWTLPLLQGLHLRLPMEPAKGYSVDVARPASFAGAPVLLAEESAVLTPLSTTVRVGSVLELAGMDTSIDPHRIERLRRIAARAAGVSSALPSRQVWRGLRPTSPDGLPFIGPVPHHENVILATGHGMLGLSLGPVTGLLVAELAGGATPSVDIAPLSPARFS